MSEHWQQIDKIFHEAMEREPDERALFLDRACSHDPSIRTEIEALISSHKEAGNFLDSPVLDAFIRGGSLAGKKFGSYEVKMLLGSGGMGDVYRARDSRLKRDVAIKVLPHEFSVDPDRVARFQREAEVLAALNHPNIAAIYDVAKFGEFRFLVMEIVEGETLEDHIARGPLPLDEALRIAKQVTEALAAAHEKGTIHRDLKPGNIKVTRDGTVKVLDFGLAKVFEVEGASPSNAPTKLTASAPGMIMGTPAYMSPEQAKGKQTDRTTDVWAFGCVLYEMLAGTAVFEGETVGEILENVFKAQPDWHRLPAGTPPSVRRLLRRCLEKEEKHRLHDLRDVRLEIDEAQSPSEADGRMLRSGGRETVAWIVASVCIVALAAALALGRAGFFDRPSADPQTYRSSIVLPEGLRFGQSNPAARFALSPDGRRFAFVATDASGKASLWIRPLDTTVAQPLAGTDGAAFPFWSPDSRFLAFLAQGKLKKVDASGGPVVTLCDATSNGPGSWNRDDVILFTPKGGAPLHRVYAQGGTPAPATTLDASSGDTQHWYPFFLPDGRHFLYFALGSKKSGIDPRAVYVGSLDANEPRKLLLQGGSNAKYAEGHLIFMRGRTLMAQAFDVTRLELRGEAVTLAEQVQIPGAGDTGNAGAFSVAETGALVYQTGLDMVRSQLAWFDRTGNQTSLLGDQADYSDVAFSGDGKHAAVSVLDPVQGTRNLWLYDVARGLRTRFTFDPADEISPIWSADGSRILFGSGRQGGWDVYQKRLEGAGTEDLLFEGGLGKFPQSSSPDGRFLLYVFGSGTMRKSDLWVLPLFGDHPEPFPFVETPFSETQGQFSPDGRWIAFASEESGQRQVYVAPFPEPGRKWLVSTAGGGWPRWRRDEKEIFYLAPDNTLTAVTVNGQAAGFDVGAARSLFVAHPRPQVRLDAFSYDVSRDGQHFLVNTFVEETTSTAVTLVVNWTAGLKK